MIKCNLAVLLAERNLKISELSKRTGISRTTLTALSQNQSKGIQFDTFDTICSYLKISPNELFLQVPFEYDFEVTEITAAPINSNYSLQVTVQAEIIHNKIESNSSFVCRVSYLYSDDPFSNSEITGLQVFPDYDFDTACTISGIPISFKLSMENELMDAIKSEIIIKYALNEDLETFIV